MIATPSDAEISHWRLLRNAVQNALTPRGVEVSDHDLTLITRFILEEIEAKGLYVVPAKPTRAMISASLAAMDEGKRLDTRHVHTKTKHRWRIAAALKARTEWRSAYQQEVEYVKLHGVRPPAPGWRPIPLGEPSLTANDGTEKSQ